VKDMQNKEEHWIVFLVIYAASRRRQSEQPKEKNSGRMKRMWRHSA
jgi:hypothetical protein